MLFRPRLPLTTGLLALAALGCSDALEQDTTAGQVIVVADSSLSTVTLVSATRFRATAVPAGGPFAAPVRMTARDSFLLFPVGAGDSLAVLRLLGGGGAVPSFIPLGSGARAVGSLGIQSEGIAWVPLAGLDRVMQIDWLAGDTLASAGTGPQPMGAVVVGQGLFVVNANAVNDTPAGLSSITWFGLATSPAPLDTIPLTGTNAQFLVPAPDGLLYVVDRGAAGQGDGRLSIVDPGSRTELAVLNGLGELPGPAVYHPSGRLLIASATEGILEVNTLTRVVVRGAGTGFKPAGDGVTALAVDQRGRVYAVGASCAPGVVRVLTAPPAYHLLQTVPVGSCLRAAAVAYSTAVP
ncbi:MAG: hypothetical protein ACREMC_03220 [Gemmatimonadales bacterium]